MSIKKLPIVISLVGMSGVGKSYWSETLEKEFGYKRVSIDEIIANALKLDDVHQVAEWLGQPQDDGYFDRQNHYLHLEEQALELVLETLTEDGRTVIDATGSVVFLSASVQKHLAQKTTVIRLENPEKDIAERVMEYMREPKPVIWRNHFSGEFESSFRKLLHVRNRLYTKLSELTVDVSRVHTIDEFVAAVDHAKSWPYEGYLQHNILPLLENGRPNWDMPHTQSVVRAVKLITEQNPALQINIHMLIIVGYMHDYGYSELYRGNRALYPYNELKTMHAKRSREKWHAIENESVFSFLKPEQKERIAYLIEVHDELEKLHDVDELVFMEADTIGALETALYGDGWRGKALQIYLKGVKKNRLPLFLNETSKRDAKVLIKLLNKKISWWTRIFG